MVRTAGAGQGRDLDARPWRRLTTGTRLYWPAVDWLLVGAGSFAGGASRYLLGRAILGWAGEGFPWHTLTINVTGSLVMGVVAAVIIRLGDPGHGVWRLLLMSGFLGGYTTFSAYSLDVLTLLRDGHWVRAVAYGVGSGVLGLAVCALGFGVASRPG